MASGIRLHDERERELVRRKQPVLDAVKAYRPYALLSKYTNSSTHVVNGFDASLVADEAGNFDAKVAEPPKEKEAHNGAAGVPKTKQKE